MEFCPWTLNFSYAFRPDFSAIFPSEQMTFKTQLEVKKFNSFDFELYGMFPMDIVSEGVTGVGGGGGARDKMSQPRNRKT